MFPNHAIQTDPYLHEPKGISTAAAGTVYQATGSGTGVWTSVGGANSFANISTSGLLYTVSGGFVRSVNSMLAVAGTTLTLTDAATNYVYVDAITGLIGVNTTGLLPSHIGLHTVVTSGGTVVTNADNRGAAVNASPSTYATVTMTDANKTLSAFEYSNKVIKLSGTTTVARSAIVPVTLPATYFHNATAYTTTIIGATGTGIGIATTKKACVYGDGVNIVRLTADI